MISHAYKDPLKLLIAYIIGYAATYAFNVFFARMLGANLYGDFSLGLRLLAIAAPLIMVGTTMSARRFIAEYVAKSRHASIKVYLTWNFRLLLIAAAVTLVVVSTSIVILIALHIYDVKSIESYHLALYLLYLAPIIGFMQLIYSILLAYKRLVMPTYFTVILPYLLMNFFLFLLWVMASLAHTIAIVLTVLCAYLSTLLIMLLYVHWHLPQLRLGTLLSLRSVQSQKRLLWFRVGRQFMFNSIVFLCISAIDLITIEMVMKDERKLGYYAAALMIANVLTVIRVAFNAFLSVEVSQQIDKPEILQNTLNKMSSLLFVVVVAVSGILVLFSQYFLGHFGVGFLSVEVPLLILIVSTGVDTFLTPAAMLLLYGKYEHIILRVNIFSLICFVFLCPFMTYYFGLIGTSTASALTMVVPRLITTFLAKRQLGIRACLVL